MPTRPAADVEHPRPFDETECLDEKLDLLLSPLREGITQVRLAHVCGQLFEPMSVGADLTPRHHHSLCRAHFASAHVRPQAAFTSSGTASSAAPRMMPSTNFSTAVFSATGDSTMTSS